MLVLPWLLRDVIDVMPEIVANCFSSGVATDEAIVSGLAPGQVGVDLDRRVVDGRQVGHGQLQVAHDAEDENRQDEERRRDGPPDECFREIHCEPPRARPPWPPCPPSALAARRSPRPAALAARPGDRDLRARRQAQLAVDDDFLAGRQALAR